MSPWTAGLALSALLQTGLWALQRRTKNAATADLGWALSLGAFGALHAASGSGHAGRRLLAATILAAWSLRLSWHLLRERALAAAEDGRYAGFRRRWGAGAAPRFFALYLAQTPLAALLSVPLAVLAADPRPPGASGAAGAALAAAAVTGETWADRQLAAFRADPAHRGRTCREGLWRYSRHPNYFFEWLFWWGFVVMAAGSASWGWTLVAPLVMAVFLVKLTGVALTEAHALKSRPDYADYVRSTSMFIPWFPK
ncbi:MAG: DUF1295 domain-containing protein [Elusimicrobia bacterium]|nr:DUF1295 domain-containing protein [Elusimicrobiota bacterium]